MKRAKTFPFTMFPTSCIETAALSPPPRDSASHLKRVHVFHLIPGFAVELLPAESPFSLSTRSPQLAATSVRSVEKQRTLRLPLLAFPFCSGQDTHLPLALSLAPGWMRWRPHQEGWWEESSITLPKTTKPNHNVARCSTAKPDLLK